MFNVSAAFAGSMFFGALGGHYLVADAPLNEQSAVTISLLIMGISGAFILGVTFAGVKKDIRQMQKEILQITRRHSRLDRKRGEDEDDSGPPE